MSADSGGGPRATQPPAGAVPGAGEAPSFGRALKSRPFFFLWSSQLVSQSGDFVFEVALLWLVLQTTGSVLDVSLVVVAAIVPTVVFGPVLGVYVDRWPRRTILLGTNVAEGLLVAALSGLVLAHAESLPLVLAIVFALSVGGQLVRTTSSALVPQTVGTTDLSTANGLLSFSSSTTQIVGLSVGGAVVALFGPTLPIAYDAVSFFAAALIVLGIAAVVGRPEAGANEGTFSEQFREGFRYVVGQRFLLEVIGIGVVTNFAGNAAFSLWAPYADYVLHGNAFVYGLLGAGIAVGAIVGALAVGKLPLRPIAGRVVLAGLFGFGLLAILLGLTRSVPLAIAESFGVGVLMSVINIPLFSVLQARVPARIMGRATSVLLALIMVAAPFGAFFAGELASATSIGLVYVVAGAVVLVAAAGGTLGTRDVRELTY